MQNSSFNLYPIPSLQDNYIWMINHPDSSDTYLIDPGCADAALDAVKKQDKRLKGILITHHHPDHTRGIQAIIEQHACPVWGPKNEVIPCRTHAMSEGQQIYLSFQTHSNLTHSKYCQLNLTVLDIPGHTIGHIAYLSKSGLLFSGDTLFSGGCGRLLGGTTEQLFQSLLRLAQLPSQTQVYCSHEYTQANLKFAMQVEPDNTELKTYQNTVKKMRNAHQPSLPTTIALEKAINPFLRCHQPKIQENIKKHFNIDTSDDKTRLDLNTYFKLLRQWKDHF